MGDSYHASALILFKHISNISYDHKYHTADVSYYNFTTDRLHTLRITPISADDNKLILKHWISYHKNKLNRKSNNDDIVSVLKQLLGKLYFK
jgi:hypothetical protein